MAATERYWSPSDQQSICSTERYTMTGIHTLPSHSPLTSERSTTIATEQKTVKITRKRGRSSAIPPEFREQNRKIKKQHMERRRRACISDKMNALHNLAMKLIGENPVHYQKIEKADLLSMCYTVFENVVAIVNEEPDIRSRVQQLTHEFREKINANLNESTPNQNQTSLADTTGSECRKEKFTDQTEQDHQHVSHSSFDTIDEESTDSEINKENHNLNITPQTRLTLSSMTDAIQQNMKISRFANSFSTPIHPKRYILSQWNVDSGYEDSENSVSSHVLPNIPSKSYLSLQNEHQISKCSIRSDNSLSSQSVQSDCIDKEKNIGHQFEMPKISKDKSINYTWEVTVPNLITTIRSSTTTSVSTLTNVTNKNTLPKVWRPYLD